MNDKGVTRQKIKGTKTKKRIYEAARTLFGARGYDTVGVDDIVREAGVSKGTFYIYFESKDTLIASLVKEYVETVDLCYQKHLDSLPSGMASRDALLSLIEKIVETMTDDIGLDSMRLVYRLQLAGDVSVEIVKGYNRELYRIFGNLLSRGIDCGEFCAAMPLEEMTNHFVTAIRGMCFEWCIRHPDFDFKQQALTHFSLLMTGIQKQ